jgi:hypothetical protein
MTYYDAAIQVLTSAREPLTTRQITQRAIASGLIIPLGKTPEATMAAALYGRVHGDHQLAKLEIPGSGRAKRGSVRWTLLKA